VEYDIEVLTILAEVTIGFVAFTTIVAAIKLSLGGELTPYQKILIHYFTESSLLMLSIILLSIILVAYYPGDDESIARIALTYSFITTCTYLFFYLRRRLMLKIPTAMISLVVIVGYFVMITLLGITISPLLWPPMLAHISYMALWNFVSCAAIFTFFLGTFIDSKETE